VRACFVPSREYWANAKENYLLETFLIGQWEDEKNSVIPDKVHYGIRAFLCMSGTVLLSLGILRLLSTEIDIPYTNRKRRTILPHDWENAIGEQIAWETIKLFKNSIVDSNHPLAEYIETIGNHICTSNNLEQYHFFLVQNSQCNAISLPGKTIIVFTGILPVMANQSGCAVVLAHELSHLIAHHSIDMVLLSIPIVWLFNKLAGNLGGHLVELMVTLPQSRENELEADKIGLHLMARACFDIDEAPKLMKRLVKDDNDLEWLGTHPAGKRRVENLEKEKQLEEVTRVIKLCQKLNSGPGDFLTKFDYEEKLPRMSLDKVKEMLSK